MQIGQNLYEYDKWFVFDDKGNWVERKDTLDNVKRIRIILMIILWSLIL